MARRPEDRYPSIASLAEALRPFWAAPSTDSTQRTLTARPQATPRRSPWLAIAIALGLVLTGVALASQLGSEEAAEIDDEPPSLSESAAIPIRPEAPAEAEVEAEVDRLDEADEGATGEPETAKPAPAPQPAVASPEDPPAPEPSPTMSAERSERRARAARRPSRRSRGRTTASMETSMTASPRATMGEGSTAGAPGVMRIHLDPSQF